MCGIAGYIGPKNAVDVVLDQLSRLEYRGYDSAGVGMLNGAGIKVLKKQGKLDRLRELVEQSSPNSSLAIAHSRWATHGPPTDINAHPHCDGQTQIALIHNGIIENYLELKQTLLEKGHEFESETDTEVAAHLIASCYGSDVQLEQAVTDAVKQMKGAYAFVVMSAREPDKFVCARSGSPLVMGFGEGENLVASDIPALLPYTREIAILEDDQIATITRDGIKIQTIHGRTITPEPFHVDWDIKSAEKGGFKHFMLKEIMEQPDVVRQCLAGRCDLSGIQLEGMFSDHVLQEIDRVNIVACGTAYHAGLMGKYLFETMLQLPTDVYYSSEFRYGDPLLSPKSLAVFVSQSGETADSLAALRLCKARRIRTLGVVNVVGSSIAREVDKVVFCQAGPEISVASTKAYVAQSLVLMLVGMHIATVREMPGVRTDEIIAALEAFSGNVETALKTEDQVKQIAEQFKDSKFVFFLGRRADAHVALEAALKLKEIAYIPTQECPAGEMKHGPLALVEQGTLAIVGATAPDVRDKIVSNIRELQARGAHVVAITTEDDRSLDGVAETLIKIPNCGDDFLNALCSMVPLQLLAYHMADSLGCEIDQPRNLAKSVTVE